MCDIIDCIQNGRHNAQSLRISNSRPSLLLLLLLLLLHLLLFLLLALLLLLLLLLLLVPIPLLVPLRFHPHHLHFLVLLHFCLCISILSSSPYPSIVPIVLRLVIEERTILIYSLLRSSAFTGYYFSSNRIAIPSWFYHITVSSYWIASSVLNLERSFLEIVPPVFF